MLGRVKRRRRGTAGGDKGYDSRGFVEALRKLGVTPHVAQNPSNRASAIDARTTRLSQVQRKGIESSFGWLKTVGLLPKVRHRGRRPVGWTDTFGAAVYDLVRMRALLCATG